MSSRLFFLDQGLKDVGGHYFEYARAVASACSNSSISCIIGASKYCSKLELKDGTISPVFSDGVWATLPGLEYDSPMNLEEVSKRFVDEAQNFLEPFKLREGDIIFLPNIAKPHMLATAMLAEKFGQTGARFFFLLRYPFNFYEGETATEAFKRLEVVSQKYSVTLCTDSHRLGLQFQQLTALPFYVFPIPHTDFCAAIARSEPAGGRLHAVSLGNARGEKGIAEIFQAIRLSSKQKWARDYRFTLQVNDPYEAEAAINEYLKDPDSRVTLIHHTLDTSSYYELLSSADIVLTPYHRSVYQARTSGIFLEAILAGKITVCTKDTWMSDLLAESGGGLAVEDRSPASICSALELITKNKKDFFEEARSAALALKKIHSAENLVARLTGFQNSSDSKRSSRNALVVFPWGDALMRTSGGSVWLDFLVRYLESRFTEVRILFAAVSERGGTIGVRSVAEPYYYYGKRAKILRSSLQALSTIPPSSKDQGFHLWYHLWPLLDRRLERRFSELVEWSDEIYCEYSYFVPVLAKLTSKHKKPLHVTMHDIVSHQSLGSFLINRLTRYVELSAAKKGSHIYAVSDSDHRVLEAAGIKCTLLAHPIDLDESIEIFTKYERKLIIESLLGREYAEKKICFFIGSKYGPNEVAARFVYELARRTKCMMEFADVVFVVVGGCMAAGNEGANFVSLGSIEKAALNVLYSEAELILVPLTEGSGTSVKSIEALARGSLILSTSLGMRGLPVTSGAQCVIEDDLDSYPERISELLRDKESSRFIRQRATKFARNYDYRVIFRPYVQEGSDVDVPESDNNALCLHRRSAAILELIPRFDRVSDPHLAQRLKDAFENEHNEVLQGAHNQAVSVSDPSPQIQDAPKGRGATLRTRPAMRAFAKRILLLAPPIRALYQNILAINARLANLERDLRAAKQNSTALEEKLEYEVVSERWKITSDSLRQINSKLDEFGCSETRLLQLEQKVAGVVEARIDSLTKIIEGVNKQVYRLTLQIDGRLKAYESLHESLASNLSQINLVVRDLVDQKAAMDVSSRDRDQAVDITLNDLLQRVQEVSNNVENTRLQLANVPDSIGRLLLGCEQTNKELGIRAAELNFMLRDQLVLLLSKSLIPALGWTFIAERQLAADTNDHLFPRGTRNDNTRHPRFVRACENVLGAGPLRHMDIGCAGGGLVWDFTCRGHLSVGLEGSDYNLLEQRAEWRTIPDRLFTADICYPFRFEDSAGEKVQFDIISAWELFEHIPETLLPSLLNNITSALRPRGLVVASVATFLDQDEATGVVYHHTVQSRNWWEARFRSVGLVSVEGLFETSDFVRGIGNPTAYDWDVSRNPELGFHLVLRYEP